MSKKFLREYKSLKKQRSALLVPSYAQVLVENFSYTDYLKDAILYTKGICDGYFAGYDEIDVSKFLSTGGSAEGKNINDSFFKEAEKKLGDLANEYALNIDSSFDGELDKSISLRMVLAVTEAIALEKEYNEPIEEQRKR